jgi:hypothetical protein
MAQWAFIPTLPALILRCSLQFRPSRFALVSQR